MCPIAAAYGNAILEKKVKQSVAQQWLYRRINTQILQVLIGKSSHVTEIISLSWDFSLFSYAFWFRSEIRPRPTFDEHIIAANNFISFVVWGWAVVALPLHNKLRTYKFEKNFHGEANTVGSSAANRRVTYFGAGCTAVTRATSLWILSFQSFMKKRQLLLFIIEVREYWRTFPSYTLLSSRTRSTIKTDCNCTNIIVFHVPQMLATFMRFIFTVAPAHCKSNKQRKRPADKIFHHIPWIQIQTEYYISKSLFTDTNDEDETIINNKHIQFGRKGRDVILACQTNGLSYHLFAQSFREQWQQKWKAIVFAILAAPIARHTDH